MRDNMRPCVAEAVGTSQMPPSCYAWNRVDAITRHSSLLQTVGLCQFVLAVICPAERCMDSLLQVN